MTLAFELLEPKNSFRTWHPLLIIQILSRH